MLFLQYLFDTKHCLINNHMLAIEVEIKHNCPLKISTCVHAELNSIQRGFVFSFVNKRIQLYYMQQNFATVPMLLNIFLVIYKKQFFMICAYSYITVSKRIIDILLYCCVFMFRLVTRTNPHFCTVAYTPSSNHCIWHKIC